MVIKAIAYGFEEKRQRGAQKPRGLFNIKREVEEYLKAHSAEPEPQTDTAFARSSIIEQALKRLDRIIIEEKREDIREKYEKLRQRVRETDEMGSANIYKQFNSLWRGFVEDVFSGLSRRETEADNGFCPEQTSGGGKTLRRGREEKNP